LKKKSIIVKCPANTRLQNYLLQKEIHILTPCSGRGNCGKCKVRVLEGTAKINTMDRVWFSEEELQEGYRLGCQLYAQDPLTVELYL
jgi:Na+-transporting NADH:ubiquinone oxidoreductase subunit NqrF